jgi:hypothetical protein
MKERRLPHVHRPIAEPRSDPFSHPSNPFHSYFQSSWHFALLALPRMATAARAGKNKL